MYAAISSSILWIWSQDWVVRNVNLYYEQDQKQKESIWFDQNLEEPSSVEDSLFLFVCRTY